MFCSNCGKQLGPETNFCPACGTKTSAGGENRYRKQTDFPGSGERDGSLDARPESRWSAWNGPSGEPVPLVRPRYPRVLGGVCAAFALHYGWNLDVVRIVAAIFALFYGVGIFAYVACWIILPEAPYSLPWQSS